MSTPSHQAKENKEEDSEEFSEEENSEEEYIRKEYPRGLQDTHESIWKCGLEEDVNVGRFPAILRTNGQIYDEASYLFYSELEVILQPGDVLCMKTGKDIVKASERLWRHNPLNGTGTTDSTGLTVYSMPELDGVMEPHVLARFKRIAFELDCSWEMEALEAQVNRHMANGEKRTAPSLFINEDMTVNPWDEVKLLAFYRRSTMIHQLVRIVLNSPRLFRFRMTVDIEVLARYDMNMDSISDHEKDGYMSDLTLEKTQIASHRAIELFLDSGLLAPLEKLSNVQSFAFDITAADIERENYKPTPKHSKMLLDMKTKIEHNYTVRNTGCWITNSRHPRRIATVGFLYKRPSQFDSGTH